MSESPFGPLKESFGYIISFLLPGMVALLLASATVPEVASVWARLSPLVGSILIFVLAAIGAGLLVFAIWAALFRICARLLRFKTLEPVDLTRIAREDLVVQEQALDQSFRYYQFYGNMFTVLIGCVIASWLSPTFELSRVALWTAGALGLISLPIAVHSYGNYRDRVLAIATGDLREIPQGVLKRGQVDKLTEKSDIVSTPLRGGGDEQRVGGGHGTKRAGKGPKLRHKGR